MKRLIACLFLLSTQIFPQTYLVVSYDNGDPANSTNLTDLKKITFSGTDITFLLSDNSTVSKNLSILNDITYSGTDGGNPLPVELVSFTALLNNGDVTLLWETATEKNNYGFEVERSLNLRGFDNNNGDLNLGGFSAIGFVEGSGNSNSPKQYSFTDYPQAGTKLKYRLKQIDTDGQFQYSSILEVESGTPIKYELKQNYPNPFNPVTNISYTLPMDGFVTLKVYDIIGKEVATLLNENKKAGSYEAIFDGSSLASGVYFFRMNSGSFSSKIKMILLK